jgi:hypothetical protein
MKFLSSPVALLLLTNVDVASAFSHPSSSPRAKTACSATANRRDFISAAVATSAAVGGFSFPSPSLADVSDGNSLPQGAAQFSRVIKVRAQLKVSACEQNIILCAQLTMMRTNEAIGLYLQLSLIA